MPPTIYAFGSNGNGQLSLTHQRDVSYPSPCAFTNPPAPTSSPLTLAAGGNHTLLLYPSGAVYATGDNSDGRCGLPPKTTPSTPITTFTRVRIPIPAAASIDTFSHISATWSSSIFIHTPPGSSTDLIYTSGSGAKGELGLGPSTLTTPTPRPIPSFPPDGTRVTSLASGLSHTVAILSTGAVWGWGSARAGELGEPDHHHHHHPDQPTSPLKPHPHTIWSPHPVTTAALSFPVSRAVCGRAFTALFAAPEDGRVVVLGRKLAGASVPGPERLRGWVGVAAGWGAVYAVMGDGGVVGWGRTVRGWGKHEVVGVVAGERVARRSVRCLVAGSEHVLLQMEDGAILAAGWGEHGNCGPVRLRSGDGGGEAGWIEIKTEGPCTVLGAGCATSWLLGLGGG